MYNRYIPNGTSYTRVPMEDGQRGEGPEMQPHKEPAGEPGEARESVPDPAVEAAAMGGQMPPRTHPPTQGGLGALSGLLSSNGLGQLFKKNTEGGSLGGLLKALHLEELDTGDILLLLILLFLFLEGDNIELVITLGLVLLLGLGDHKKDQSA